MEVIRQKDDKNEDRILEAAKMMLRKNTSVQKARKNIPLKFFKI